MNQSSRGATHLHQQLPLDLLRAGARETHVAGGAHYMRLRAYLRRERDASAPILCLWHGPIWSVLLSPCRYPRSSINTAWRRIARCGMFTTLQ